MKRLRDWLIFAVVTIVLGVVAYAIYTVRNFIPVLGLLLIGAIGLAAIVGLVILIVLLLRIMFRVDSIQVGQYGTVLQRYKQFTYVKPEYPQQQQRIERGGRQEVIHIPASVYPGRRELEPHEELVQPEDEPWYEDNEAADHEPELEYKQDTGHRSEVEGLLGGTDDLLRRAKEAYASGHRSRNKLAAAVGVTPHRAIQLIATIEGEQK